MDATSDDGTVVPIIIEIGTDDTEIFPDPTNAPADRKSTVVQIESNAEDELDDDALIHTMLRKAAADPDQPSVDHWQLLSGFSGDAVEDAYQAEQASGRVRGVYAGFTMVALWTILTNLLGNGTAASKMLGLDFPIFLVLHIISLAPLTVKLLQEWKPVKHRILVHMTCCAIAALTVLVLLAACWWLVMDQGDAVSRPNLVTWTTCALVGYIYTILVLRPSIFLISATCTVASLLLAALGYYSGSFDNYSVAIVACIFFNVMMHMLWFILESTSRTSFVHQLSAVTSSVAASHAKSEQEKEKAKALEQQKAYQKIVAATAHKRNWAKRLRERGQLPLKRDKL